MDSGVQWRSIARSCCVPGRFLPRFHPMLYGIDTHHVTRPATMAMGVKPMGFGRLQIFSCTRTR
jgi:hypothetical protein